MTKQEARQALDNGDKVRHFFFAEWEFIFRCPISGQLKDEDGVPLDEDDFWNYRNSEPFEYGWTIDDED